MNNPDKSTEHRHTQPQLAFVQAIELIETLARWDLER
jgi:hypothetical protein